MSEYATRELRMVRDITDPAMVWSLADHDFEWFDETRPPRPDEITAEALADMMDRSAEGANAHDFVGVHRGLAQILGQEVGRGAATRVLRRLVNYEGLYGLVGVCCSGDVAVAERELGCSLHDWAEWTLAEKGGDE